METATQRLHRLTSFTWDWYEPSREDDDLVWSIPADDPRIVRDLEPNDLGRFPWFFKRYAEPLPRVPLPRSLPSTTAAAVAVLAGAADVLPTDPDLQHLSRLLHLSAGVVRTTETPYTTWLFRAAGSAGARFPLEIYVAVPDGTGLPAGVHWYDPLDHALVRVGPPPRGDATTVVVTGVPWRTGWRYRERGYRHVYWDAGTMLSQSLAAADSAGITARLHTRFSDAAVAALVGADRVHEWPVAVVALGDGSPALESAGPSVAGEVDAAPIEFPLVTEAQRAGERDALGPPWTAVRRWTCRDWGAIRSRQSYSPADRRGVWIPHEACPSLCSARPWPRRNEACRSPTSSSCTTSMGSRPASIAGPTFRRRRDRARCAGSSTA